MTESSEAEKERAREYYKNHKEEVLARHKKYYEEHRGPRKTREPAKPKSPKESKPKVTKEERKQQMKEYDLTHPQKRKLRIDKYRATTKGKMTTKRANHVRRSRVKQTQCDLNVAQWELILFEQDNRCNICGCLFDESCNPCADHIFPLSKGGGLTYDNVQALCRSCNAKKWAN